ncbi:hypothetical protein [Alkaliphilus pronyensis]|uniref:hypothetical protein n=1 Tax=Alkaliphilus pronyensis TaxID=1482732 RepID=UPI0018657E6B|nr:hypothetical protein [Alkaliphilus pronyensis]
MQPSVKVGKPTYIYDFNCYSIEGRSIYVNKKLPFNNQLISFVLENADINTQ